MTECLALEKLHNNKLVTVSVVYRSPRQYSQEFAQFEILYSQLLNDITSKNPLSFVISIQGLSVVGVLTSKVRKMTVYF